MSDVWSRQRLPIWIVALLFVAGAVAIVVWHPVLIFEFPREEFLEWYIITGLLAIGLTAAIRNDPPTAAMFGLFAIALAFLTFDTIPPLLAQLVAMVCVAVGVVLAVQRPS